MVSNDGQFRAEAGRDGGGRSGQPMLDGVALAMQRQPHGLRQAIRGALLHTGLYERLVWTPPHRWWVRHNNPSFERMQRIEGDFYRELLPPRATVFDIGANMGNKAEVFARLGARVVAVEPDPMCARVLRGRFVLNRRVTVLEAAVSSQPGERELYRAAPGDPLNTLSAKWRGEAHGEGGTTTRVAVTTLDALTAQHGAPTFVKADVEGSEIDVLRGLSQPIPLVSFEVNLPGFLAESLACVDRLLELSDRYRFRTANDFADGWQQPRWIEADELRGVLTSGRATYYEVFARI
jgi:FkbM family methyltransferase